VIGRLFDPSLEMIERPQSGGVSSEKLLVGIVTLDDVLQILTEQQIGLVKIVVQEQRHGRTFGSDGTRDCGLRYR
jgi:hypothetical protein